MASESNSISSVIDENKEVDSFVEHHEHYLNYLNATPNKRRHRTLSE
jgi:hypothetical protein